MSSNLERHLNTWNNTRNNTEPLLDVSMNMLIGNQTSYPRERIPGECGDWKEAQHSLFQLANLCLILSFLIPNRFRHYRFCLRLFLGMGYLFFSLWSGLIVCMPDVLGWSAVFFLVNFLYLCYIGYRILPSRVNKDLEELYQKLFEPLRVSRSEYDLLVKHGSIYELERFGEYAREGVTRCGLKTSILIKGRLKVLYEDTFVHYVERNQFVDSPEYDLSQRCMNLSQQQTFQVSIQAVEESLLLTWSAEKLRQILGSNYTLSAIFNILIGKDISDKLYQIQEMLLSNPESPLGRKNDRSAGQHQIGSPSPNLSMVNLRSVIAANGSLGSLDQLNSLGPDFNDWSQYRVVHPIKINTFESQV